MLNGAILLYMYVPKMQEPKPAACFEMDANKEDYYYERIWKGAISRERYFNNFMEKYSPSRITIRKDFFVSDEMNMWYTNLEKLDDISDEMNRWFSKLEKLYDDDNSRQLTLLKSLDLSWFSKLEKLYDDHKSGKSWLSDDDSLYDPVFKHHYRWNQGEASLLVSKLGEQPKDTTIAFLIDTYIGGYGLYGRRNGFCIKEIYIPSLSSSFVCTGRCYDGGDVAHVISGVRGKVNSAFFMPNTTEQSFAEFKAAHEAFQNTQRDITALMNELGYSDR